MLLEFEEGKSVVKALVYKGPGKKSWEEVPDPAIV